MLSLHMRGCLWAWSVLGISYAPAAMASAMPTTTSVTTQPTLATTAPVSVPATQAASQPQTPEAKENRPTAEVELYLPSVQALVHAARRSRTAALCRAVVGMIPSPPEMEDEPQLDVAALLRLAQKIGTWPDTSVSLTIYTQDRDGRPRWAVQVDWPLPDLVEHLEDILSDEATGKLLGDVALHREDAATDDGPARYRLELPDVVLAVLSASGSSSLIASAEDLQPSDSIFGRERAEESKTDRGVAKKKKRALVYCRFNLEAGEQQREDSLFSTLSGIRDVRYWATLKKSGLWNERFSVSWNPLLGMALKAMFRKARRPFACPKDAYAAAVVNLGLAEGLADAIAGLLPGTIGGHAGSEMAVTVAPGTGFLPFPDVFYEFRARKQAAILKDIRRFIEKANKKRRRDDRPPLWHESEINGRPVFWHNPASSGGFGFSLVSYRTVIFFVEASDGESKTSRLIIAQTSTWAEDTVRRWAALCKKTHKMPSSKKLHWQARIGWRKVYELVQPYLALLAGFSEDAAIPPEAEALGRSLADAVVDVKIGYGGLHVRHTGPIPIGAFYVPTVAVMSLRSSADPSSESAREQVAARHLRVLYHQAKLFKKDYGRWPATVAELDGYVDFSSHPELLRLRARKKSFAEGLTAMIGARKRRPSKNAEQADETPALDDSLYVIRWSADQGQWRLGIREGEFAAYKTMYIDAGGEIHRVAKDEREGEQTRK